jgi:hypothetical protein
MPIVHWPRRAADVARPAPRFHCRSIRAVSVGRENLEGLSLGQPVIEEPAQHRSGLSAAAYQRQGITAGDTPCVLGADQPAGKSASPSDRCRTGSTLRHRSVVMRFTSSAVHDRLRKCCDQMPGQSGGSFNH